MLNLRYILGRNRASGPFGLTLLWIDGEKESVLTVKKRREVRVFARAVELISSKWKLVLHGTEHTMFNYHKEYDTLNELKTEVEDTLSKNPVDFIEYSNLPMYRGDRK